MGNSLNILFNDNKRNETDLERKERHRIRREESHERHRLRRERKYDASRYDTSRYDTSRYDENRYEKKEAKASPRKAYQTLCQRCCIGIALPDGCTHCNAKL